MANKEVVLIVKVLILYKYISMMLGHASIVMNGLKNRAMTLIAHIAAGVPRLHMKFIGILISMLEVRTLERCGGGKIINTK